MGIKEKISRASELYKQREFDLLSVLLEQILKKNSNLFDALHLKALMQHQLGELDESINIFNRLIKKTPYRASLFNNLGNVFVDKKEFKSAENSYHKALQIKKNYCEALINLANTQKRLSKHIDAEKNFQKAIQSNPIEAKYLLDFSIFLTEQGRFHDALNLQLKILEIDSKQSEVYFQIFSNFMFLHQYEDALEFADIGLMSHRLDDFQLCELLIGKAILFWLFDNDIEGMQAILLSEKIHTIESKNLNLKNHRIFHHYLKQLFIYRQSNQFSYTAEIQPSIYFISESNGFAPNGMTVKYQNKKNTVKSLFITGTKIFHLIGDYNQYKSSLKVVFSGLPKSSTIILGFGEIDCRVNEGIFNYSLKHGKDPLLVVDFMLEKYFNMLKKENKNRHTFIIYGVPSPHPQAILSLDVNKKNEFKLLIAYFNSKLKKLCKTNSMPFLDVYKLTDDNGVSNLKYHIDVHHVKPNTVSELFELQK
ncbi:tetratricopeptide repeat protein [Pseudoalteromonas sp. SG45-3]|uniref:tetratricopeptide repeat protein n=1 Tax=Pseudoalteromonas sp. SG45-3 TaxID=2760955 RepID=UPI0016041212|nr:tetratricopeptide repeat protein [Pseudoalteromonas sp. SG45-3]MBB1351076.1 hypothetical protein [Pseudoalteromonas sp. SG45-3]